MKNKMIFFVMIIFALTLFAGCTEVGMTKHSLFKKQTSALYPAYSMDSSGKKWGYINEDGTFIIKPKYESAADFQGNGLAQISENGRWGLIDNTGKIIKPPQYWYISNFAGSSVVLCDDSGKSVLLDEKGRILFQIKGSIDAPSCGMAAFRKELDQNKSLWGYINEQGKVIIEPKYEWAQAFSKEKALVKISAGHFAIIDKEGKILNEIKNKEISSLSEDILIFSETWEDQSQKCGYMTLDGKLMMDAVYSDAKGFENGLAIVNTAKDYGNAFGVIKQNGEFIIPARYSEITSLKNGIYAVPKGQDYSFNNTFVKKALFDKTGKQLTEFIYYDLESLGNGLISATDEKRTYLLYVQGNTVKSLFKAEGIGSIKPCGKLFKVETDNHLYYLTKEGKTVWSADNTMHLDSGLDVETKTFRPDRCMLIQYPEVNGLADARVQAAINGMLKDKFIGDNKASNKEGENYTESIDINYTAQRNKDLLIISQNSYTYPIGAAHGQPGRADYHIDIKTGKLYTLQDLFKNNSLYNEKLTGIINKKIAKTNLALGEQYYSENIDDLEADNRFAITKDALLIYFHPYEIACYAAGFPEFYIPYNELSDSINKDGDFWNSFAKNLSAKPNNPAEALYPGEKAKAEEAIKQYENKIIKAVNQNDFNLVEPWLYPESSLYNSQKKLVADLSQKGIKERLENYSIKAIEADNLGVIRAYVTENIGIQYSGQEYTSKQFKWVYCLKYAYELQQYQLTYIEKWE